MVGDCQCRPSPGAGILPPSVFGWVPKIVSIDDTSRSPAPGEAEYTVYTYAGAEVAGGAASEAKTSNEIRPGWINYIQVADVDVSDGGRQKRRQACQRGRPTMNL